jgi:hypothetical protein
LEPSPQFACQAEARDDSDYGEQHKLRCKVRHYADQHHSPDYDT